MNLTQIHTGETVTITAVKGHHHIHERLTEMGFVAGRDVTLLYRAPIGTPLIFDVLGTQVA
ncbi:MAG: FeoA domain-containing protein, partial [Bacteroidaceae bacterium]|nr:FeoA domain-containing protein [Bacteroidaceae bacterium]